VLKLAKEGELSDNDFAGLKWAKNLFAFSTNVFKNFFALARSFFSRSVIMF
jgi:hypothetical protein